MTTGSNEPSVAAERVAPVNLIVTQRVKPGLDDEVREWQDSVNRAVVVSPGFLGIEVPLDAADEQWTVLFRFDSTTHLKAWLESPAQAEALERGKDLFAAPATRQILADQGDKDPVTVVVSHQVAPDQEDEFRAWHRRVTASERAFRGFRGSELFPPVPGLNKNWTAIFRFDTKAHLDAWLKSPARQNLLKKGERFQFELHRPVGPFGSWFSLAGDRTPDWKEALTVLMGLYPIVVALTILTSELFEGAEIWWTLLLGNIASVSALTWIILPWVNRKLDFWLKPDRGADCCFDIKGAVFPIMCIAVSAFAAWLVTTQIWTLP